MIFGGCMPKKEKKVVIYSTKTCPWCKKTKEYLNGKKIKFKNVDVGEDSKKADEMIKKSGQSGVPVIDIDGKIIVGFDKEAIDKALGM